MNNNGWVQIMIEYDNGTIVHNSYTPETIEKMRTGEVWMVEKDYKQVGKIDALLDGDWQTVYLNSSAYKKKEREPMENDKDLVVLPKEVADNLADWINHYRRDGMTDEEARRWVNSVLPSKLCSSAMTESSIFNESRVVTRYARKGNSNLFKINSALVNGFTVEKSLKEMSPEEQLLELYNEYKRVQPNEEGYFFCSDKIFAIHDTLNILGIEIEGINK